MLNPNDVLSHISFLLVFLEGLLSFLSPCVLPLLPVYMGYLAGQDQEQPHSQRRIFLLTVSFVIGIFTAILLMNISVHVLSSFFKDHMVYFVRIGGILIVLLGLHQLGIWKFKSLERTWKLPFQKKGSVNAVIAFLMGFTFSFAWTPCIGPALSSILLLASSSGSLWVSTFLMIVYALGFTIPFLILGLFTGKVLHWISNHKNIMKIAVKLGAVILIAIGLMMFTGKMNTISSYMSTSDKATAKKDTDTATPEQEEEAADTPDAQTSAEQLDFVLTDQNGKQVSLGDYRGKVIFLNFWATWCPPCQRELPHIQELSEKYRNSDEVAVLTVVNPGGQEKSAEGIRTFLDEHAYSMPVLFDDGSMYYYFQITSMPTTFMIDKNGKPFGYIKGQLTPDMMENMIQQTLSGKK